MTKNQASLAGLVKKPEQERFNPLKTCINDDADMRKTAAALTLALLITAAAGALPVRLGKANPYPSAGISLTINNPQNATYTENPIQITFTAREVHLQSGVIFSYNLDNKEVKRILNITTVSQGLFPYNPPFYLREMSGNFQLFNLSEGWHTVTVYCNTYELSQSYTAEDKIGFFVDAIPIIAFLSFENKSFVSPDVPLNFTVDQPMQITYSLDGQENVTVAGNSTLSGLPVGSHNVTVYAWDAAGNVGASETVVFTVAEPERFPSVPVAAVSALSIAAVTAAGLIFTRRRRRKEAQQK